MKKFVDNTNNYIEYRKRQNSNSDDEAEIEDINNDTDKTIAKSDRANRCRKFLLSDIENFIATKILMSIERLPAYDDHFNEDLLLPSFLPELISWYKYENMESFFHEEAQGSEGPDKILPMIK